MKFPKLFRFRKSEHASAVARQRLLLMNESEPIECTPDVMAHMKQDISEVIGRYLAVTSEEYEIKITLKRKRPAGNYSQPEPTPVYNLDAAIAFTTQ